MRQLLDDSIWRQSIPIGRTISDVDFLKVSLIGLLFLIAFALIERVALKTKGVTTGSSIIGRLVNDGYVRVCASGALGLLLILIYAKSFGTVHDFVIIIIGAGYVYVILSSAIKTAERSLGMEVPWPVIIIYVSMIAAAMISFLWWYLYR